MSDDQQPTPPPLDLNKMEAFARKNYFDAASVASADVLVLLAEVRRLRAEVERLSVLASVTTSEALAGVTLPPDVTARLLAEQERDEARADLVTVQAALTDAKELVAEANDCRNWSLDWWTRARALLGRPE